MLLAARRDKCRCTGETQLDQRVGVPARPSLTLGIVELPASKNVEGHYVEM
jgi:hypothetical protein